MLNLPVPTPIHKSQFTIHSPAPPYFSIIFTSGLFHVLFTFA